MDINDWLKKQDVFGNAKPLPDEKPPTVSTNTFAETLRVVAEAAAKHNTDAVLLLSSITNKLIGGRDALTLVHRHDVALNGGEHPHIIPSKNDDNDSITTLETYPVQLGTIKCDEHFMVHTVYHDNIRITFLICATELQMAINSPVACMNLRALERLESDGT